jgi:SnoaL-like protein
VTPALDHFAVIETLDRYAVALDTRDWSLLDRVFTPDATGDFAAYRCASRDDIRKMIQNMLGGCGPTQHMLGVYRIEISGDEATSTCAIRAHHVGRGAEAQLEYECFGEYRDRLVRTTEGWRICHRAMRVTHETGTRAILKPA